MIQLAAIQDDGRALILLGLTEENLRRLPGDEPIRVALDTLGGGAVDLVIFAGVSEQSMLDQLVAAGIEIGDVRIDPRLGIRDPREPR